MIAMPGPKLVTIVAEHSWRRRSMRRKWEIRTQTGGFSRRLLGWTMRRLPFRIVGWNVYNPSR